MKLLEIEQILVNLENELGRIKRDLEKGFVKDVLEKFPEPRPAYNTVSTICRILVKKGFLNHRTYGNSHQYYPLISREDYTRDYLNNFVGNYFGNSIEKLVSFFSKQNKVDIREAERIIELMKHIKEEEKDE